MVKDAPMAIVVCADKDLEKFPASWVLDCAAATENMLLAATARGLGAPWTAVYPFGDRVEGIKNLLNLPVNVIPLCVVPVGHPDETPVPGDGMDIPYNTHLRRRLRPPRWGNAQTCQFRGQRFAAP